MDLFEPHTHRFILQVWTGTLYGKIGGVYLSLWDCQSVKTAVLQMLWLSMFFQKLLV